VVARELTLTNRLARDELLHRRFVRCGRAVTIANLADRLDALCVDCGGGPAAAFQSGGFAAAGLRKECGNAGLQNRFRCEDALHEPAQRIAHDDTIAT